jgi:hypothetical protein
MGASTSTPTVLPFPPSWLTDGDSDESADDSAVEAGCTAIQAIAFMPVEHFLRAPESEAEVPLAELARVNWLLAWSDSDAGEVDYKSHAAAAMQYDSSLNRLTYQCVPKRASEAEFWRCYYVWAHQLLVQQRGLRTSPATAAERQLQQAAEEQAESIEDQVAQYDEEVMEPLRAELATLQAEHRQHLAQSTQRSAMRASAEDRRAARKFTVAIEEAEARLDDAKDELRERMADVRKGHRKSLLD